MSDIEVMTDDDDEKLLSNKPPNTAFLQQTSKTIIIPINERKLFRLLLCISSVFLLIGFICLFSALSTREEIIDYTYCKSSEMNGEICADIIEKNPLNKCKCIMNLTLKSDLKKNVFIYYRLTNFFQNHRRYVKSRDDRQLHGILGEELNSDCSPFDRKFVNNKSLPIAPCGAIANSMFNDTIILDYIDQSEKKLKRKVFLLNTDIAWSTDKYRKFANPPGKSLHKAFKGYTNPPNWNERMIYDLDKNNKDNNGFLNEQFIVWMRTAALPTFRKLYARVDHNQEDTFQYSLPAGKYILTIDYNFPVKSFDGTKSIIISNTSWMGGRNLSLAIMYLVFPLLLLLFYKVISCRRPTFIFV